jgi:hypothetical protein
MNKAFWRVWGKWYGYPSCCTDEMLHHYTREVQKEYGESNNHRKLIGTGFIPCSKCNKMTIRQIEDKITLDRLSKARFPSSNFKIELQELLRSDKITAVEKKLIQIAYKDLR